MLCSRKSILSESYVERRNYNHEKGNILSRARIGFGQLIAIISSLHLGLISTLVSTPIHAKLSGYISEYLTGRLILLYTSL